MTVDRVDISDKVMPLIKRLNIPISQLAQELGMKYQLLYTYVTGTSKCQRDVAQRIMSHLSLKSSKEGIQALQLREQSKELIDPAQINVSVPGLDRAMDEAIVTATLAGLSQHFEMDPTLLTAQALTLTQACLRRGVKTLSDLEAALQSILSKNL